MRTTLLAFFCLFVITSFAQDSSFQIKDYKYRTPGYRALTFSTSLSGTVSHRTAAPPFDSLRDNHFQLYPTSLSYNKMVSTDRKQSWSYISVYSSYYSSFGKKNYSTNERSGNGNVQWKFDNRYFGKNNWFWQIANDAFLQGNFDKETISPLKHNDIAGTEALTFGFGKGRIEMVRDAQMALYILKDLKAEGLIGEVDSPTIFEFGRLITEINNKRVFDSRRRRIYELTQIDSFLRQKGVTKATDIRYFATINDDWSFAYNPMRFSGQDWFFHLVPGAQYEKYKWRDQPNSGSDNSVSVYSLMPQIGFDSHKPLSLQWQSDFSSTVSWARNKNTVKWVNYYPNSTPIENKSTLNFNETRLSIIYGIGYFPNTRTSVNTSLSVAASYFTYKDSYSKDGLSLYPALLFSGDYFISYRTRLTANVSINYRYDNLILISGGNNEIRQFNLNFDVGLTHAFL